ncbi:hypothetical protein CEXT_475561 [Caerostris extrusa]|uniref:Uncharacterized protein n=1 Tax=Caerostris extrusa TaxID=172846 RepID=A0AAV4Y3A8_CAEEX|nr:hypothetical protein CEXT_475561 [Caerostris extrusa]
MINDLNSTVVNEYPSNWRHSKNSTGHCHKKEKSAPQLLRWRYKKWVGRRKTTQGAKKRDFLVSGIHNSGAKGFLFATFRRHFIRLFNGGPGRKSLTTIHQTGDIRRTPQGHYHRKKKSALQLLRWRYKKWVGRRKTTQEAKKRDFLVSGIHNSGAKGFLLPLFTDTSFVFSTVGREGRLI